MIMHLPYWTRHCEGSFLVLAAEDFSLGEYRSRAEEEVGKEERTGV